LTLPGVDIDEQIDAHLHALQVILAVRIVEPKTIAKSALMMVSRGAIKPPKTLPARGEADGARAARHAGLRH
jgi:hypothetical protein